MKIREIYCCKCESIVNAEITFGNEIYPRRPDLSGKLLYRCPICCSSVGTHPDGRPLGSIPTREIKGIRQKIHAALDPLWKSKRYKRGELYAIIAKQFDLRQYHTGEINSLEFGQRVFEYVCGLYKQNNNE